MDDNYKDNLSDFFRNKLNQENSDDSWDRPDSFVWESAKESIPDYPEKKSYRRLIIILLGLLFLLSISTYIFYLNNNINKLEQEVIRKNNEILFAENRIQEEKNNTKNRDLKIASLQNKINQDSEEIKNIRKENILLKNSVATQERISKENINSYKSELRKIHDPLKESNNVITTLRTRSNNVTIQEKLVNKKDITTKKSNYPSLELLSAKEIKNVRNYEIENSIIPSINLGIEEKKKKRRTLEIGYGLALTSLKVPYFDELDEEEPQEKEEQFRTRMVVGQELKVAYPLNKNLTLRTGIKFSNFRLRNEYDFGFFYDKSEEYIDDDGELSNDIEWDINTPFISRENQIGINVPDEEIEDGDFIYGIFNENQKITLVQIPFGISGKINIGNRISIPITLGGQFNRMKFKDYSLEGELYKEDTPLDIIIKEKETDKKDFYAFNYASIFSEVELDYNLKNNLYAYASAGVNYNLLNNKESEFSNRSNIGTYLGLGLKYRF